MTDLRALARAVLANQGSVSLFHFPKGETVKHQAREWSASDWREYFDERAGIAEHDGGLSRPQAEGAAWEATIAEWCKLNPPARISGQCAACDGALDMAGHGWRPLGDGATVHYATGLACWKDYGAKRRAAAIKALQGFGIGPPGDTTEKAA